MNTRTHLHFGLRRPAAMADVLVALGIVVAYTLLLLVTDQMGYTRDESFYFKAGREYAAWFQELVANIEAGRAFESFRQASIDRHWGYNPEHPVILKTLFGLSHWILHEKLAWLDAGDAFRLPAMGFAGALVGLLWIFTVETTGSRLAAAVACLGMGLMPHWFFHSHLACFDVPITTLWVAVVYAWWRSLGSTGWAWMTGILWGVALGVKLNAFFLPVIFIAHWFLGGLRDVRIGLRTVRLPPIPMAWPTMLTAGPIVFLALWPRHWFDTWNRIAWYVDFHLRHEHYYVDYFGRGLWKPPFPIEYPFVLTAITTPVVLLLAMLVGIVVAARDRRTLAVSGERDDRATGILFALNILVPFLIIAMPDSPVFGGTKHWFPALPFLMTLAGLAVSRAVDAAAGTAPSRAVLAAVALAAIVAPCGRAIRDNHPFGISWYNEVIGGHTGAADAGMMRQFWGYASLQALPWLNANVERGGSVNFHDTTGLAYDEYRREERLRDDIRYGWDWETAGWTAYDHQRSFEWLQVILWTRYETQSPSHVVSVAGVPLISVYRNVRRSGPPPGEWYGRRADDAPPRGIVSPKPPSTGTADDGSGDTTREGSPSR